LAARNLQRQELGTAIYGETKFMDLTPSEFKEVIEGTLEPPELENL
jgi:hypothetical protein